MILERAQRRIVASYLTFWLGLGPSVTASAQAPGLSYTPEQMMRRIVEIAEGPEPTRAGLEREFGFEFKTRSKDSGGTTYQSKAGFPFLTDPALPDGTVFYNDFVDHTSIYLRFEDDQCCKPRPKFCISSPKLFQLLASRWQRHQLVREPHSRVDVHYTATIGGVSREFFAAPIDLAGEYCLSIFAITFLRPVPRSDEGIRK